MSEHLKQFFDGLRWGAPPVAFVEIPDPQDVLIFRGHHALDESDASLRVMGLLHGSAFFKNAAFYGAPLFSKTRPYLLPRGTGFMSVYKPFRGQLFFPDETMEYILMGEDVRRPARIGEASLHEGNAYETHIDLRAGKNQLVGTYAIRRSGNNFEIAEIDSRQTELSSLLLANPDPRYHERARQNSRHSSFENNIDKIGTKLSEMNADDAVNYYQTLMALTEDRIQQYLPMPSSLASDKQPPPSAYKARNFDFQ